MQISNAVIIGLIKECSDHYRTNIANHYTSRALAAVPMDTATHTMLAMFTEHLEDYHLHGLDLHDLYVRLLAAAKLVQQLRSQVLPNIRKLVYSDAPLGQAKPSDKVMRDMAIANFAPNLRIYSEKLAEIYALTEAYDLSQVHDHKGAVKNHVPELNRFHEFLGFTGNSDPAN